MGRLKMIPVMLLLAFTTASLPVNCQVEGESEVVTIAIRKPVVKEEIKTVPREEGIGSDVEENNHALIIGVDNYEDALVMDLDKPIEDAGLIYEVLTEIYLFDPGNVRFLKDPTRADIINELDALSRSLTEHDNLIIFYAGHGLWDPERETGYWLPSDADNNSSVNWIRNSTIQDFVEVINTQHTLLITNACFAGSIFKSRGGFRDASIAIKKLYSLPSRKAMTSGTLEMVPDRSVFLEYLLKRLRNNEEKYLSAGDLFSSFRESVLNNSPNIPQYGVIQDTGDEGGDYIFVRR